MSREVASDYLCLIRLFLSGDLSAVEFQRSYLSKFKDESREYSEDVYYILDKLFADLDAFEPDGQLIASQRMEDYVIDPWLDESQIKRCASEAFEALIPFSL